jgi:hypothetical protein
MARTTDESVQNWHDRGSLATDAQITNFTLHFVLVGGAIPPIIDTVNDA